MSILFNEIVFGPIHSRRLGVSLGINLLPTDNKLCNFNCIYCECGWNSKSEGKKIFHTREEVFTVLEEKLRKMQLQGVFPDSITFSGNGEPTINPYFPEIVDDVLALRNRYAPKAKVSVLSNATTIANENVFLALKKVDNAILKLDSGIEETIFKMNQPQFKFLKDRVIGQMKKFGGKMVLQTMFLRGIVDGHYIDNTSDKEINAWLDAVKQIDPNDIMIYTIDRETPASDLQKVSFIELDAIAFKARELGYIVHVAKK